VTHVRTSHQFDAPAEYVKIIASLLPKELLVRKDPMNEMSDEEIDDVINEIVVRP